MTPLETDLDVFLSSNAGIEWRSAVQELDTQYHTVSVIGTDPVSYTHLAPADWQQLSVQHFR